MASSGQTGLANPVIFDTKKYDTGSNYSVSTGLFTVPITGFYHFNAVLISAQTNGQGVNATIQSTGSSSQYIGGGQSVPSSTLGNIARVASGELQLVAGDVVSVYDAYGAGATLGTGPETSFSGFLMCNA